MADKLMIVLVNADPSEPAELGPPYAHWRRFVAIPMTSHLLRRARPALLDLFLHAPR